MMCATNESTHGKIAFSSSGIVTNRPISSVVWRRHLGQVLLTCSSSPMRNTQAYRATTSRRSFLSVSGAAALYLLYPQTTRAAEKSTTSAYDIAIKKNGSITNLASYKGKVTLFVNVATYCALTPQYEGLVALHDKYKPQGFEIVASPCDQFGHQEPGSNEEICKFAKELFGAKFLLIDKLNVNDGPGGVAPLYKYLKDSSPEGTGMRVSWNFEKFLVGPNGNVLRRYKPGILPEQISGDVEWALKHPGVDLPPKKKPSLGVAQAIMDLPCFFDTTSCSFVMLAGRAVNDLFVYL